MADEGDLGAAREEELRADALAAWRRRAESTRTGTDEHGRARTGCEECGEPISAARRAAVPGCARCVECQEEAERRSREGGA